jgi:hypothetical protein
MNNASRYLDATNRLTRLLLRQSPPSQRISVEEYANNVIWRGAEFEFDENIAKQIVQNIPAFAAAEFLAITEKFLLPSYQYTMHWGGPGPSASEREELNAMYTKNIKSWSQAYNKHLIEFA